jgi:imidazolonepropionase
LIRNACVVTCDFDGAQGGVTFAQLRTFDDGAVLCEGERVAAAGPRAEVEVAALAPGRGGETEELDAGGRVVVPGFVDAHAHPLFAGDRAADFAALAALRPPPLGMPHTVERTRAALAEDPERFWMRVDDRLRAALAHGTTTLECKTGYALTADGELALLAGAAARSGRADLPRLIVTLLGAHVRPPEFSDTDAYVEMLIERVLPFARARGARYADVFCEAGFFTPAQARCYLAAAREAGLRLRAHCDELAPSGATALACELGADAVDHVNHIAPEDVARIAASGAVAVVCPGTIAYLGLRARAPVPELLAAGAFVALASDFNPGTSPCVNLAHIAHLGRRLWGLSAAEALHALTLAPSRSLREEAGRLVPGAVADAVILDLENPEAFGVAFGTNAAHRVVRAGVVRS